MPPSLFRFAKSPVQIGLNYCQILARRSEIPPKISARLLRVTCKNVPSLPIQNNWIVRRKELGITHFTVWLLLIWWIFTHLVSFYPIWGVSASLKLLELWRLLRCKYFQMSKNFIPLILYSQICTVSQITPSKNAMIRLIRVQGSSNTSKTKSISWYSKRRYLTMYKHDWTKFHAHINLYLW